MKFDIFYTKDGYIKTGEDKDFWQEKYETGICLVPHPFLNILYKYKDQIPNIDNIDVFIETGSFTGYTAETCAKHFKEVHTVEKYLTDEKMERYKKIRGKNKNVNFYSGNSPEFLTNIMHVLDKEQCVILLDAHNGNDTPLIDELKILKQCKINNHVILVDDSCDFGCGNWPTEESFHLLVREINKNYNIIKTGLGRETILIY